MGGHKKFGEHCPPIPPGFTGLVLTTHCSLHQRVKRVHLDMHRDARGWRHGGGIAPLTFQKGETVTEVSFDNSIIGDFMVCQHRPETNLLQLFAHPENLE